MTSSAVKRDLVISAYRPEVDLERRFELQAGTPAGTSEFVQAHLAQVPVFVASPEGRAEVIAERLANMLFNHMVAFHVRCGAAVPLSAGEFYAGLRERYPERDDMFFLPEQVAEYDRQRLAAPGVEQLLLTISDEDSAIQWLRLQLRDHPRTFQEIQPEFMRQVRDGWQRQEKPLELFDILRESFLCYDGRGPVPEQICAWLARQDGALRQLPTDHPTLRARARNRWYIPDPNRARDLDKIRERALLKEFEGYTTFTGRRLKVFRLEAIRAGFRHAWSNRDYATILKVAEKLPDTALRADDRLLTWYDQAITRTGGMSQGSTSHVT